MNCRAEHLCFETLAFLFGVHCVLWAYSTQWNHHSHSLPRKTTNLRDRHEKLNLQHENICCWARKKIPRNTWMESSSPCVAFTRRYFFGLLLVSIDVLDLADQHFSSYDDVNKNWLDSWIATKDMQFLRRGIDMLPERWEKVAASDWQYFE